MQLEIAGLTKVYKGGVRALSDATLTIRPGVLGLLGPNGAGKSTLMRILATITKPTSGSVRWDGADVVSSPDALRGVLGYLPQDFGVYPNLSALEFLEYVAAVKGIDARAASRFSAVAKSGDGSLMSESTQPGPTWLTEIPSSPHSRASTPARSPAACFDAP